MEPYKIGFLTGIDNWVDKQKLAAKYLKMSLRNLIYPDVYCLPYFLTDNFRLLRDGDDIEPEQYDLIFSELNGSFSQLEYLESCILRKDIQVVVIPGPPEILSGVLTNNKLIKVNNILSNADHVWTYSENIRSFCDGLIGFRKTELIPWPFDLAQTVRIGRKQSFKKKSDEIRILLNAPLRFHGQTKNFPFLIKSALLDIWRDLKPTVREKINFYSFVYTKEDRSYFNSSEFSKDLPIKLKKRMNYRSFVRFIASCDAVINLTVGAILGRITFISAAFEKPGLFSDNAELNKCLYPESNIPILNPEKLKNALDDLLKGLADNHIDNRFFPSRNSTAKAGDFKKNAQTVKTLLKNKEK